MLVKPPSSGAIVSSTAWASEGTREITSCKVVLLVLEATPGECTSHEVSNSVRLELVVDSWKLHSFARSQGSAPPPTENTIRDRGWLW